MSRIRAIEEQRKKRRRWALLGLNLAVSAGFAGGCQSIDSSIGQDHSGESVVWTTSLTHPSPMRSKGDLPNGGSLASAHDGRTVIQVSANNMAEPAKTSPPAEARALAVPKSEEENTIDLASAFRLAGMDSPTINLTREVVREALARQQAAEALLLPTLNAGFNYHMHTGNLQPSSGLIRSVNSQDLYAGSGARALAAETVAFPGIRLFSHLGDAIYEPLAARQFVESRRSDAAATENDILLRVAGAYFDLLGAEVRLEAIRSSETELTEVVRLTEAYAKRGQGRIGDAHRAETNASLLRAQSQEAEGNVAAASARLTGLLSLDPSIRLRTPGGGVQPVRLIDDNAKLEDLIEHALGNRPEMRARIFEIAEARTRVRQERLRPLFPTLSIGFSAGTFGGGSNLTAGGIAQPGGAVNFSPRFGRFDGRTDFDVFAVWTLQNGGVGNLSLARRAEAVAGRAVGELQRTQNEIRAEVAEALADVQAAARRIEQTRLQLPAAEDGFHEEMTRTKQAVGRPLEVIDSFRQLLDARQDILAAVISYDAAQYRLFVAVGSSPLHADDANSCGREVDEFRNELK